MLNLYQTVKIGQTHDRLTRVGFQNDARRRILDKGHITFLTKNIRKQQTGLLTLDW